MFLEAAKLMNEHNAGALDSLHAAFCRHEDRLISSDKVFDRLGLRRVLVEGEPG
ncbi:MAG TPA: PIN domain-containing protein [Phycisphaerae bacterium]|nr:PIN domain-containing protein [Phycisphaerae bacterium]